jgi:hypothetical protein
MTDVNDRTKERYEPEWDGEGPPPAEGDEGRRRMFRRFLAARVALFATGAVAATWGLWTLWGAPAAAIFGGFVLLRAARFRRHGHLHHRMHPLDGPSTGRARRFHFGCGSSFFGPPFRQPMV